MSRRPSTLPAADSQATSAVRRDEHSLAILGGVVLIILLALIPDLASATGSEAPIRLDHGRITALGVAGADGGGTASVLLLDGPRSGETVTADLEAPTAQRFVVPYAVGDEVVVQVSATPEGELIAVADRWRLPVMGWLVGGFALMVVLVGGWRGVRALLALVLTVGVVIKIVLPLILVGWPPVPLAVGAASAITVVTLALTEGLRRTTLAAAIGTFAALAVTAVLAAVFTAASTFSQLQGSEDAGYLRSLLGTDFDLGGLLLAAVILGALGVLDDVTITQAATVGELAEADPQASRSTLARRAMNVGRSHIAATINTLVLAYVAASLPLLLLFAVGRQAPATIASMEVVAIEVVRALVGSIGIVAAVPLTTFVAAWLVRRD